MSGATFGFFGGPEKCGRGKKNNGHGDLQRALNKEKELFSMKN
jgi:hypothetical protein